MGDLLRKLGIYICKPIYNTIPNLYSIFYNLANARFLTDDTIKHLSGNIYVLVSVVMLFVFSASMLSAIVNPDILSDKKKGMAALVKRSFIGIIMIVLIPFAFNEAYDIQAKIMDNTLIEKIIVGINYDTTNAVDGKNGKGGNGGQVIAGTLISSVLYPVSDNIEVSDSELGEDYTKMVTEDISYIKYVAKHINDAPAGNSSEEYAFEFSGLIAIIAGIATVYILLLFSMDTAVRMFKLAFFELTAPISIIAYIAAGDDSLKRWASEVGKTYVDVFARIAAMAFYLFMLSHMDDFINGIFGNQSSYNTSWMFLLRVIVVVGLLIFIKQVPDLINTLFKTNIKSKGGIEGRLGSMAAVGDTAKKAWGTVKKGLTAAAPLAAAVAAGPAGWALGAGLVGGGAAIKHGWKKGFGSGTPWKDTDTGKALRRIGTGFKAAGAYLGSGNALKGISAAEKVVTESELGKQRVEQKAVEKEQTRASRRYNDFMQSISANGAFDANGKITDSLQARSNINAAIDNSRLTDTQKTDLKNLIQAKSMKATLDTINSSKSAISDKILELENSTTDENLRMELQNFRSAFNLGQLSREDFNNRLNYFVSSGKMSSGSANNLAFNLDKINNTIDANKYELDENGQIKLDKDGNKVLSEIGNLTAGGKLNVKAITQMIASNESDISIAQAKYDKVKGASTALAQELMENIVTQSARVDKKVVYDQGGYKYKEDGVTIANKYGGDYNDKANYKIDNSAPISSPSQVSSSTSQSNATSYGPGTYSQDEMEYYNQSMNSQPSSNESYGPGNYSQDEMEYYNQNTNEQQTSSDDNGGGLKLKEGSSNDIRDGYKLKNNDNSSNNVNGRSDDEQTQLNREMSQDNESGNGQPKSNFKLKDNE